MIVQCLLILRYMHSLQSQSVTLMSPHCDTTPSLRYTGFIQTLGLKTGDKYPPNIDSLARITVPFQHVTLVSFDHMETHTPVAGTENECDPWQADYVQLYLWEESRHNLNWTVCNVDVPPPQLYRAQVLLVRFVSDESAEEAGFRLLFSFVQVNFVSPSFTLPRNYRYCFAVSGTTS